MTPRLDDLLWLKCHETVLFHLHIKHTAFSNITELLTETGLHSKGGETIHVQFVHFYEKCHCYLHFEKMGPSVMSSHSRFWILGNLLLFSWPVFTLRLGLVGSLSTFLPKDSCLGAKRKRHGWPWKVEKKHQTMRCWKKTAFILPCKLVLYYI